MNFVDLIYLSYTTDKFRCVFRFITTRFPVATLNPKQLVRRYFLTKWKNRQNSFVSGVRVTRSLVLCVVFCRSLFVLLFFFLWPLCCLFFFDLRILVTPLVSSSSSSNSNGQHFHPIWFKTAALPPNIWENPILGHIQMNFRIWMHLKNQPIRELHVCDAIMKKCEWRRYDFTSGISKGRWRVHLDITSNRVLSNVKGSVAYNSWFNQIPVSPISTKRTNTYNLKPLNTKRSR